MPMIDVYAAAGTFPDAHGLARDLAAAVMRWEQVPDLPLFANNTAAFIHDMEAAAISNVAGDVEPARARVLYAVQQPLASSAFTDVMGVPAWKSLPSWYLVAENDEAIPPDAERQFAARMGATTVEIPSSHVAMVSHPAEVTELVQKAAEVVDATAAR